MEEYNVKYNDKSYYLDLYGELSGPQVLIECWGKNLGIELYATTKTDPVKKNALRELNMPTLEIDIRWAFLNKRESELKKTTDPKLYSSFMKSLNTMSTRPFDKVKIIHLPEYRERRNIESKKIQKAKKSYYGSRTKALSSNITNYNIYKEPSSLTLTSHRSQNMIDVSSQIEKIENKNRKFSSIFSLWSWIKKFRFLL